MLHTYYSPFPQDNTIHVQQTMFLLPIPFLTIRDNHLTVSPSASTVTMLMDVLKQLSANPRKMGYLRSAGRCGAKAFDGLINSPLNPIPLCVELKNTDVGSTQYIPLRLMQCPEMDTEEHKYTGIICSFRPRNLSNNTVILSNTACTTYPEQVGLEMLEGHPIGCLKMVVPQEGRIVDMSRVEPTWGEDTFGIQVQSVLLDDAFLGITTIPNSFLDYFIRLPYVDLTPLQNVTKIGNSFLHFCVSLKAIDVSPLAKVDCVGVGFLSDCPSLRQVTGLVALNNAKSIGANCFANCRLLLLSQQVVDSLSDALLEALDSHFNPHRAYSYLADARNHLSDDDKAFHYNNPIDDDTLRLMACEYGMDVDSTADNDNESDSY